jgi:O-antigen/teichoic acid export membrane protein
MSTVVSAALSAVVARQLSHDQMAAFAIAYATATVGSTVADFGTGFAVTRSIARSDSQDAAGGAATVFLIFRLCTGMAVAGLLWLCRGPIASFGSVPALRPALPVACLLLISRSLCLAVQSLAQGYRMWTIDAVVGIAGPATSIALVFMLGARTATSAGLLMWHVVGFGIAAAAGTAFLRLRKRFAGLSDIRGAWVSEQLTAIWTFGWPMGLASVSFYLMTWGENLIIGRWRSAVEVSAFFVANTILMLPRVAFSVLETVAYVEMSSKEQSGVKNLRRIVRVAETMFVVPLCFVCIVLFFTLGPVVTAVYGPRYVEAATAARWLLPVLFFRIATVPITTALSAGIGDSKALRDGQIITLFARLGLGFALIPSFGYRGAAAGALVAHVVCWTFLLTRRSSHLGERIEVSRTLLPFASCVALIAVAVAAAPLLGRALSGTVAIVCWTAIAVRLYRSQTVALLRQMGVISIQGTQKAIA